MRFFHEPKTKRRTRWSDAALGERCEWAGLVGSSRLSARGFARTVASTLAAGASFTARTTGRAACLEFLGAQEAVAILVEMLEDFLAIRRLLIAACGTFAGTGFTLSRAARLARPAGAFASTGAAAGTAGRFARLEFFEAHFAVAVLVEFLEDFRGVRTLLVAAAGALARAAFSKRSAAGRLATGRLAAGAARSTGSAGSTGATGSAGGLAVCEWECARDDERADGGDECFHFISWGSGESPQMRDADAACTMEHGNRRGVAFKNVRIR